MNVTFYSLIDRAPILRNIARHLPTMPNVGSLISSCKSVGQAVEDTGTWADLRNRFLGLNLRNLPHRVMIQGPKASFRFLWDRFFPLHETIYLGGFAEGIQNRTLHLEWTLQETRKHNCDRAADRLIQLAYLKGDREEKPEYMTNALKQALAFGRIKEARQLLKKLREENENLYNSINQNPAFEQLFSFLVDNKQSFTLPDPLDFDLNERNGFGYTPLHLAVILNHSAAVKVLLERGAEIRFECRSGRIDETIDALGLAILSKNKEILKLLLADKQRLEEEGLFLPYNYNEIYVRLAVGTNDIEIVGDLIQAGANVNVVKNIYLPHTIPLYFAICNQNEEIFDLILSHTDETVLRQKLNDALEDEFESEQEAANAFLEDIMTPLLWHAAQYPSLHIVKKLIERGANVNGCNKEKKGLTALHNAARHGQVGVINLLVEAGANVNALDQEGKPPSPCNRETFHALVKGGLDVNRKVKSGYNYLHLGALKPMNSQTISFLLEHGAKLEERSDKEGLTALQLALTKKHTPQATVFLDHIQDPQFPPTGLSQELATKLQEGINHQLQHALAENKLGHVKLLIQMGADPALLKEYPELKEKFIQAGILPCTEPHPKRPRHDPPGPSSPNANQIKEKGGI